MLESQQVRKNSNKKIKQRAKVCELTLSVDLADPVKHAKGVKRVKAKQLSM